MIPSKLIADGFSTGSEDAMKLSSANHVHTNTTVRKTGINAKQTPSVGASATMWNRTDPWKRGGCRSLVRSRLIPHTITASVTAIMLRKLAGNKQSDACAAERLVNSVEQTVVNGRRVCFWVELGYLEPTR